VPRRPNWPLAPVLVTVVWVAVVVGGAFLGVWQRHDITLCPFKRVTGVSCPGCGSTRAAMSLLHGDAAKAFAWNPMGVTVMCVFAAVAILRVGAARRVRVELSPMQRKVIWVCAAGLFLANWIYVLLYVH
jgi:hypothetical protein